MAVPNAHKSVAFSSSVLHTVSPSLSKKATGHQLSCTLDSHSSGAGLASHSQRRNEDIHFIRADKRAVYGMCKIDYSKPNLIMYFIKEDKPIICQRIISYY